MISQPYRLLLFRLAERLGMLVSELEERCSAPEFVEWMHVLSLKPSDFPDRESPPQQNSVVDGLMKIFGGPRGG